MFGTLHHVSFPVLLIRSSFLYLQKKSKDHFGIEGDEGSTMVEDSVSPLKYVLLLFLTFHLMV